MLASRSVLVSRRREIRIHKRNPRTTHLWLPQDVNPGRWHATVSSVENGIPPNEDFASRGSPRTQPWWRSADFALMGFSELRGVRLGGRPTSDPPECAFESAGFPYRTLGGGRAEQRRA